MELKYTKHDANIYKRQLELDQKQAEQRNDTVVNQAELYNTL